MEAVPRRVGELGGEKITQRGVYKPEKRLNEASPSDDPKHVEPPERIDRNNAGLYFFFSFGVYRFIPR